MNNEDLKQKIKQMEAEKRAKMMATSEIKFVKPAGEENTLSYDEWWMLTNKKLNLRPHLKEIILADFKGRGLTIKENLEKYNKALSLFGYSVD